MVWSHSRDVLFIHRKCIQTTHESYILAQITDGCAESNDGIGKTKPLKPKFHDQRKANWYSMSFQKLLFKASLSLSIQVFKCALPLPRHTSTNHRRHLQKRDGQKSPTPLSRDG
jgi:hypothetical protein